MKLSPLNPVIWSILILWGLQSDANDPGVCQNDDSLNDLQVVHQGDEFDDIVKNENFSCLLYPTNILNCSWDFQRLTPATQLSVTVSVCDESRIVPLQSGLSQDKVGSKVMALWVNDTTHVVIQFSVSDGNRWVRYTFMYDVEMLEVLSPPRDIAASVKDGRLLVTWGLPLSRTNYSARCFEYQLDIGDGKAPIKLPRQLSYSPEIPIDPTSTYRVRIRARKTMSACLGPLLWSTWSHTVIVQQSLNELSILVIILISFGIPMILLALLLMVRHSRVSKVLFPPIPHPPLKYKHFLQNHDTFNFYCPAVPAKSDEEITEVQENEQHPGKAF